MKRGEGMKADALCNVCGKEAPSRCAGCGNVSYCSRQHQKQDWKEHRLACKEFQAMMSNGQEWEADVKKDEYSGTFRWSQKKDFMQVPSYTSAPCLEYGWQEYLQTRFEGAADDKVVLDVALLDGLSFPMSFLFALRNILEAQPDIKDTLYGGVRKLSIIAMGCAERAEEHILHQTNYWEEIGNLMPSFQIQLWLVGPEMSAASHLSSRSMGPRMAASCFRGTLSGFLAQAKPEGKLMVIGYNTGMASGDAALQDSWKADVQQLLQQRLLTIFTCANDHTDLKCESQLLKSLQARYVLLPRKNLFAAVTTLHAPGQQATGWYSANAFIYAVQGTVEAKQPAVPSSKPCVADDGGTRAPGPDKKNPCGSENAAASVSGAAVAGGEGATRSGRVIGPGNSPESANAAPPAPAEIGSIAARTQELHLQCRVSEETAYSTDNLDDLYLPD